MIRVWTTLRFTLFSLLAVAALIVVSPACSAETKSIRGVSPMITYPIGRFELDMPQSFSLAAQSQRLRYAEIAEARWPKVESRDQTRKAQWAARLAEIEQLPLPKGKERIVVESREFADTGYWTQGVLYYGNRIVAKEISFELLVDAEPTAVTLKVVGVDKPENHLRMFETSLT